MAELVINEMKSVVPDGALISEPCLSAGVVFNCHSGVCGSCLVHVVRGAENLSVITDEENDLGLSPSQRLACKTRILTGTVELKF